MVFGGHTRPWLGRERLQPHGPPQPLASLVVDRQAEPAHLGRQPRPPVNGRLGVRLVNEPHQLAVERGCRPWRVLEGRAMPPAQLTLPTHAAGQRAHVDHRPFGLNRRGQRLCSATLSPS